MVALVVGLCALGQRQAPAPQPLSTGAVVNNSGSQFTNGASFGNGQGGVGVSVNWAGDKIYPKSNQASWYNNTGMTQYVDLTEVSTDGTASSTFKLYAIATSSALNVIYDFFTPTGGLMAIDGFSFATSTTATTTSSIEKARNGKVIRVPDGWRINFYLQAVDNRTCPTTGLCETATSTNRGFNMFWRLRYHN